MSWIQTFTGRKVHPLELKPEDVDIQDIAHALSMQCRFSGHTLKFYSVGEHSVRVSKLCGDIYGEHPQWGLLHDASEAYLVDIPRPLKYLIGFAGYRKAESAAMRVVAERFGLPIEKNDLELDPTMLRLEPYVVRRADDVLLATEARDLMGPAPEPWQSLPEPLPTKIKPWSPEQAEVEFLNRCEELGVR